MVEVTDRVMEEVEKISRLPQMRGINIFDLDNQGDSVRESLSDLLNAGMVGALLAIIVLYLFLRQVTTTLIVTASVPFSILITLGALYFAGLSLNMLTMMGLMLAVGMLVDNAVVVTESVFRQQAANPEDPIKATMKGVQDVGLAVTAGTLTTIIVFAPIIFGEKMDITVFLTHVAVTIIVALLASLLIAQTLVPMLAARIPPPPTPKSGAMMDRLTRRYTRSLEWILVHPFRTFGGIVLTCLVGIAPLALQLVKFDAFPQDTGRRLYMPFHIEGQHPLERIEATVDQIEEYLFANQEEFNISSVYSYYDKGRAESTLLLSEEDEATLSTAEVIERIQENMPVIAIGKPSFEFDQQGGGDGFSLQITGDATSILNELMVDVARALETVAGLKDVRTDAELGEREVRVHIDRVRATAAGLTTAEIAQSVAIAMRGQNLREFRANMARWRCAWHCGQVTSRRWNNWPICHCIRPMDDVSHWVP